MSDLKSPVLRGKPHSRRQAMRLALLASSTLAIGASPALADNSTPTPMSLPLISPGSHSLVKPNSVTTPGTSYKLFSGLDFRPINPSIAYSVINMEGVYPTTSTGFFFSAINLPQQAQITEVEYYTIHNTSGTTYYYLGTLYPTVGSAGYYNVSTLTATNSAVVTVPVGFVNNVPKVNNTTEFFVLLWNPSGTGTGEVLYGARVGYTGGIGHFGA